MCKEYKVLCTLDTAQGAIRYAMFANLAGSMDVHYTSTQQQVHKHLASWLANGEA